MNSEEATKAVVESEAAKTSAARALEEATVRHATALERVETTRQELAAAHAHLANEPGAAASKRAAAARTAVDDAIAVEEIFRETLGKRALDVEVADAAIRGSHEALRAAAREEAIRIGGALLKEALELSDRLKGVKDRIDQIVALHARRVGAVDTFGAGEAAIRNEIRAAAGLDAIDWTGARVDHPAKAVAA